MGFILFGISLFSLFSVNVFNRSIGDIFFGQNSSAIVNNIKQKTCSRSVDNFSFVKDISLLFGPKKKNVFSNFNVRSKGSAVLDVDSGIFIYNKDTDRRLQIASISKLMTAMVFLEYNPGWDKIHKMTRDDRVEGGGIYLYLGEKVKVKDLFLTSLIASANTATLAMVHETGLSEKCFVQKMNEKARAMGLKNTYFNDPIGLSDDNVSTAVEVAKIANLAFKNKDIVDALSRRTYQFTTGGGKQKNIESTDKLLKVDNGDIVFKVGKTGYTDEAKYCFVGMFQKNSKKIISVILGADSDSGRFKQAKELSCWIFNNYNYE